MSIQEIKKVHEKELFKKPNVVGVMTGYKIQDNEKLDELSIICLVEEKIRREELKKKYIIPSIIEGFRTDVIQVGTIRAYQLDKTARHRPCPMGTSGGHYLISAGTNGELLRDKKEGKLCIGTNNHVGANSNNALIGDPYLQPGSHDGGVYPNDMIGTLLRFIPIKFLGDTSRCIAARFWGGIYNVFARLFGRKTRLRAIIEYPEYNLVDAALIEVNNEDVISRIEGIGIPKGVKQAELDMLVQKSGRTSCHVTGGLITGIDATIGPISYGNWRFAYFTNQIVISKEGFSAPGDSGSLVLDIEGNAIGKLFAGGEGTTIANQIHDYLNLLEADLITD
ncbi:MAG: hypothetical protein ACFFBP_11470 [Promethearchaeota archaeon]